MTGALGFARPGDETQLLALYLRCFPDGPAFWQWFFEKGPYRPGDTLVWREGEQIVSSLQMLPVTLAQGKARFAAHYIYAASTLPEHRGRGLMGRLLAGAAEEGLRRGQQYSVLIVEEPSLLDYYARFGYLPQICWKQQAASPAGLLPGERCRPMRPEDIPAVNGIYERAAGQLLFGVRPPEHWETQLELYPNGAVILEENDAVKAYCFADETAVAEAVGEGACRLAGHIAPGCAQYPAPSPEADRAAGSIRPLTEQAARLLGSRPVYLNLMYN